MTMDDYLSRPHGVDAAVPLRLRRAGRRLDRVRHQPGRPRPPTCAGRRSGSRRWAPRCAGRPSWDQFDDLTTMALRDASAMLWERTDLTPADVDVAELYDGFSFITLCWLEALGFCGHGEGGPVPRGRQPHRPRRRDPAQHPRRPALGRPAARLRLLPRGLPAALGRGRRAPAAEPARGRGRRRRRRPPRRLLPPHPLLTTPFWRSDLADAAEPIARTVSGRGGAPR